MVEGWETVEELIGNYVETVRGELAGRWQHWKINLVKPELHEVIGALLARQVTLATQLASSPGIWNAHIAPILLRSMADVHISIAWILKDPLERSRKFIFYGLGQQKLLIEHRKAMLTTKGLDLSNDLVVRAAESWLNSQRFDFLTEVNVGTWSEVPVRKMAEEAGCLDLYNNAYTVFSSATHSMWHHVSRLNLQYCKNPLHRYHKVPIDPILNPDPDYLFRAAKYVEKSFALFDCTYSVESGVPSAFKKLCDALSQLGTSSPIHDPGPQEEPGDGSK